MIQSRFTNALGLLAFSLLQSCQPESPEAGPANTENSSTAPIEANDSAMDTARLRLAGLWYNDRDSTGNWPSTDEVPITAEGQAMVDNWNQDEDPMLGCVIALGRIVSAPFPMEILLNENRATILYEYDHEVRRVYLDGRSHPNDFYPTLMGHSIGHWDDDTLVVETVGLEGSYFRPSGGLPYSDSTQITERYTSLDDGRRLQIEFTANDPTYYRAPWSVTWTYSPAADILEYRCLVREHLQPETTL